MTTQQAVGTAVTGHLRRTLRELAQLDGLSMALGGFVTPAGDGLVLSELHNLRFEYFRGAVVRPGVALGGLALRRRRPVSVDDYVESPSITHQFDQAALADGIRGAIALPILVKGDVRAVVYGATRGDAALGERTVSTANVIARKLAHDILVEEEVQLRLRRVQLELTERGRRGPTREELGEIYIELVALASAVDDPALRERLVHLSDRLTGGEVRRALVRLSKRENDVLTQLAAGYTNAEIAERLSILPTTVKTHLKSTMRKLGARNRVETVAAARYAGLLP